MLPLLTFNGKLTFSEKNRGQTGGFLESESPESHSGPLPLNLSVTLYWTRLRNVDLILAKLIQQSN